MQERLPGRPDVGELSDDDEQPGVEPGGGVDKAQPQRKPVGARAAATRVRGAHRFPAGAFLRRARNRSDSYRLSTSASSSPNATAQLWRCSQSSCTTAGTGAWPWRIRSRFVSIAFSRDGRPCRYS